MLGLYYYTGTFLKEKELGVISVGDALESQDKWYQFNYSKRQHYASVADCHFVTLVPRRCLVTCLRNSVATTATKPCAHASHGAWPGVVPILMPPPPSLADGALSFSTEPFPAVPSPIHFHPSFEAQYTRHPRNGGTWAPARHPTPHMALATHGALAVPHMASRQ